MASSSRWVIAAAAALLACNDEPPPLGFTSSTTGGRAGSNAIPGCAPGTLESSDGECLPAGMTPEDCAPGFEHDGVDACLPVLPPLPCGYGEMALPGETECRPIAPCGDAPWGDIPIDTNTVFVDASYAGSDSDGSADKPFSNLSSALEAAGPGALVAIAEGSYAGDVVVDKPLRIWGRCAALVEIVAPPTTAGLWLNAGSSGSEVHGIAVRDAGAAISVVDSDDIVLDRVWLHGATLRGLQISRTTPVDVGARVSGSLIEGHEELGILAMAADVDVTDSVVRDVRMVDEDMNGGCVWYQDDPADGTPSTGRLDRVVVEHCDNIGILAFGSALEVDVAVVRDIEPHPVSGAHGYGIDAIDDYLAPGRRASLTVAHTLVEASASHGILGGGADIAVADTVVRHSLGRSIEGYGIAVLFDWESFEPSSLLARRVVVEDVGKGVYVDGEAHVERLVARGLVGNPGRGLHARESTLTLLGSRFVESSLGGVIVTGNSQATIERTLIEHVAQVNQSLYGEGIAVVAADGRVPDLAVRWNRIEDAARSGVTVWGGNVLLETNEIVCCPISLNTEVYAGIAGTLSGEGNRCFCEGQANAPCKALSSNLEPPAPPEAPDPFVFE